MSDLAIDKWVFLDKEPDNLPPVYKTVHGLYFENNGHIKYKIIPVYYTMYGEWRVWTLLPAGDVPIVSDKIHAWSPFPELPTEVQV